MVIIVEENRFCGPKWSFEVFRCRSRRCRDRLLAAVFNPVPGEVDIHHFSRHSLMRIDAGYFWRTDFARAF